ncbi:hypothetical protein K9L16_02305 [Candidatus Pacearchaeota archaeon]|nr:hypothetical protein [Candidatus Pacearchaeota archaeon]
MQKKLSVITFEGESLEERKKRIKDFNGYFGEIQTISGRKLKGILLYEAAGRNLFVRENKRNGNYEPLKMIPYEDIHEIFIDKFIGNLPKTQTEIDEPVLRNEWTVYEECPVNIYRNKRKFT